MSAAVHVPREFIGIPYQDHGRTMQGCDCWGLCINFMKAVFNKDIPNYTSYKSADDSTSVSQVIKDNARYWLEVDPADLEPGDVLVFRVRGVPFHTGIYLGGGDFIHCHRDTHSVIERLWSITWNDRLSACYRWIKK